MSRLPSTTDFGTGRLAPASSVATRGRLSFLLGLSALAVGAGCSARENPQPVGVNCAASDGYDFQILESYDKRSSADGQTGFGWYGYQDTTPGGHWMGEENNTPPAVLIENGGPCKMSTSVSVPSDFALVLQASGFQDWGNGWGTYSIGADFGLPPLPGPNGTLIYYGEGPQNVDGGCTIDYDAAVCPINASSWDGLSFWARSWDPSGAATSKGFTLEVNDDTSYAGTAGGIKPPWPCTVYDAGPNQVYSTPNTGGAAGGGGVSAVPPPHSCGNSFNSIFTTTDQWTLYTFPWRVLYQLARPNRIPTGIDPSTLLQILIQAPKEARSYLWIDSLALYRVKNP